jgi:hypothetical protein
MKTPLAKDLWLTLRPLIGPDLPKPEMLPATEHDPETLLWNTDCYQVRIEATDTEQKSVTWQAQIKGSGNRSSGQGNPLSCPILALWLGRLCGENAMRRDIIRRLGGS